jgi:hypothetical protein
MNPKPRSLTSFLMVPFCIDADLLLPDDGLDASEARREEWDTTPIAPTVGAAQE